jgi:hypothetical protein
MFESDDLSADILEAIEASESAHGDRCRCVDCDPDTYREMEAELLAGRPGERW